uniref:Uncharacterized protein n=1 Tax=Arundo donax TaxID=35708 RepID=A0A0A9B4R2_ARUDO
MNPSESKSLPLRKLMQLSRLPSPSQHEILGCPDHIQLCRQPQSYSTSWEISIGVGADCLQGSVIKSTHQ